MKKLVVLFLISILFSCNKYKMNCNFSGNKQTIVAGLDNFDKIIVNPLVKLKLIDTNYNEIHIRADENVMENIKYEVKNHTLTISNNTNCLIENSQAIAEVTLYVDELRQIVANTDLDITSGNILHFQELRLISENNSVGTNNIADFDLQLQVNKLKIIANGRSIFKLKGSSQNMFVGFYGVSPTLLAKNLKADTIKVFQRGSGDMHIYPEIQVSGDLFGYGDIYIYHQPQIFNITEHGRGHIYFVN